jgi:hypothetical protein
MPSCIQLAGLSTAKAQTSGTTQLIANIPFEFSVGNQTLPAGEDAVRCTNPASDMKVLQLRSSDGSASVMVRTNSVIGKTQDDAKLVFNRYGDHYFFAQAWLPADSIGMQASKSRNEKQIARELAGTKLSTKSVAITARW